MNFKSLLQTKIKTPKGTFLSAIGMGFLVALGTLLLSGLVPLFLEIAGRANEDIMGPVVVITTMVLAAFSYGLILLVPAIWLGAKKGWKAGLYTIVAEIIWLVIFIISVAFVIAPNTSSPMTY
jgi:hypothetical protein